MLKSDQHSRGLNWSICKFSVAALAFVAAAIAVVALPAAAAPSAKRGAKMFLRSGWTIQSSCKISADGAHVSAPGFVTKEWYPATVPTTVLAALVADKIYPNPYFAENLRSIPGTTYPIGANFSRLPMAQDSPFNCSWWYRTEFAVPSAEAGRHVWLNFGGINNRANVWLNGHQIAGVTDVAGAYRTYEFDITPFLRRDAKQVLAVEVFAQRPDDLGINWVDWNPAPPDKDMGLWRPVYLRTSGPVLLRHPFVSTHFSDASLSRADLTVEAELRNASKDSVSGVMEGRIGSVQFQQSVTLQAGETRAIRFSPDQFAQLQFKNPKVWWPRQMGSPNLYELSMRFLIGKQASDEQIVHFGIREITSQLNDDGHRFFLVNGKKILIRGGGWAPDMLLRESAAHLESQFDYLQDMNLNTIRLEGKLESDEFYDLADRRGVLIMAGWCCCDYWEEWQKWKPGDVDIATASLRSQIMRMRNHPSMLVWLNGSDNPPPPDVEQAYINVLHAADWPNPFISSATQKPTPTAPSGVKMRGPYDYVPPDYWYTDKFGGAFGFNTETSPGPAVPPVESLRKMMPTDDIHPDNPVWNFHAGSGDFKNLDYFDGAMDAIYGSPSNFADYERKAQAMAYDSERAMFEAYSRNKYSATGVIQWMLNNGWPSLIWHLYDYYLQPAGGYFGTKKACEPLHIQYSYDDRSVAVVSSQYKDAPDLTAKAAVYDVALHQRFSREAKVDISSDGVARVFTIPDSAFDSASPVYFVDLTLADRAGTIVSRNFYWLSSKQNTFDWEKTTYRYTPVSSWEDLTALQKLPKARISVSAAREASAGAPIVRVHLRNTSSHLAFQVRLAIRPKGGDSETVPVFWSDNYIELMPGESREISARYLPAQSLGDASELTVSSWNSETQTAVIAATKSAASARADE
ncbi:MAG TPA: glycoside hydrolase family 2 protein [Candidatus Acidoferrales bacterium]|nr:glycoside hydrolase family 2 protein [Candidatus Acidoferrales bacterium]